MDDSALPSAHETDVGNVLDLLELVADSERPWLIPWLESLLWQAVPAAVLEIKEDPEHAALIDLPRITRLLEQLANATHGPWERPDQVPGAVYEDRRDIPAVLAMAALRLKNQQLPIERSMRYRIVIDRLQAIQQLRARAARRVSHPRRRPSTPVAVRVGSGSDSRP